MARVKSGLLYIDEDKIECDFCDNIKECAAIQCITGDVICICKDCLLEFAGDFEDERTK